jgi:hypothetical protein
VTAAGAAPLTAPALELMEPLGDGPHATLRFDLRPRIEGPPPPQKPGACALKSDGGLLLLPLALPWLLSAPAFWVGAVWR